MRYYGGEGADRITSTPKPRWTLGGGAAAVVVPYLLSICPMRILVRMGKGGRGEAMCFAAYRLGRCGTFLFPFRFNDLICDDSKRNSWLDVVTHGSESTDTIDEIGGQDHIAQRFGHFVSLLIQNKSICIPHARTFHSISTIRSLC